MSRIALLDELMHEALATNTHKLRTPTQALIQAAMPADVHLFGQRAQVIFPRIWPILLELLPRYSKRNRDVSASFTYGEPFVLEYREQMNRWAIYAPHRSSLQGFESFENNQTAEEHLIFFMGVTLRDSGKLGVVYGYR